MGFLLLWTENLAISLLFTAIVIACAGRIHRRWLRLAIWVPFGFVVFLAYLALTILLGVLKFAYASSFDWFYPALALTLSYLVGALLIRVAGLRQRNGDPATVPAATWPRGKLILALGVAIALHLMTVWNLDIAARQQLASLRSEGSAIILSAMPPRIADNENAALLYEQANVSYQASMLPLIDTIMVHFEKGMQDDNAPSWVKWLEWGDLSIEPDIDLDDPELARFLQKQSGTIALIFEAAKRNACYFEHNYARPDYSMLLPESNVVVDIARLLALHALWKNHTKDYQAAMRDINAMFILAKHTAEGPFMIMALIGCNIDRLAIDTLQTIVRSGQLRADDLQLVKLNTAVSYQRLMQRAFQFDEAMRLNTFFLRENMYSLFKSPDGNAMKKDVIGNSFIYHIFVMDKDIAANRWYTEGVNRLADQPYYQAKDEWSKLFAEGRSKLLLPLILFWLEKQPKDMARGDAQRATAAIALAMCRYRATNGKYAEKLDDLVPDFLPFVPIDPFDGKPMRLTRADGKLVIYSIGPDGVDDAGTPYDQTSRKGDIIFELPVKPN